jgi:hypothetical protein
MKERKPKLLPLLLVFGAIALVVVWGGVAIGTGDGLWFVPVFSADAAAFDLYWDGAAAHLEPGSAGYSELNAALKEELVHIRSYPTTVGLSDAMLNQLRQSGRLLEVHYAEPVRVHSRYHFGSSDVLYIPLSGQHASSHRVFNVAQGAPLELRSNDAILAAAEAAAASSGLGGP